MAGRADSAKPAGAKIRHVRRNRHSPPPHPRPPGRTAADTGGGSKRAKGIEPSSQAWKASALPLSYARGRELRVQRWELRGGDRSHLSTLSSQLNWEWQDSNLRRRSHQIYSLAPLTARVHSPLSVASRDAPPDGDGEPRAFPAGGTARGGTRTRNLRFTKPMLCQLSYTSVTGATPRLTQRRRRGDGGADARERGGSLPPRHAAARAGSRQTPPNLPVTMRPPASPSRNRPGRRCLRN